MPVGGSAVSGQGRSIYLVEDTAEVARSLCVTLADYGFRHRHFLTARDFLRQLKTEAPDLCIIDLGLPDMDGIELVRKVHELRGCPILILTGRHHVADRILGLELGADDYMVKPFEPREVVARIHSILRRIAKARGDHAGTARTARFAGWSFATGCNRLTAPDGRKVELSAAEARLLTIMLKRPNRILSRAQLLGDRDLEPLDRSIDARISRLRSKLENRGDAPELIKTVYGAGYLLNAKVEWSSE
ncbi:MAG: response regulator transcription factor [Hyphomicrobiaceae bacterium]|nr:MAG: response regulator transcription factor [Hyphomicrobiaceae bacterium]